MKPWLRSLRDTLVSLRLTLILLGFSLVLIFAATLDQGNLGIWAVQEKYFRTFVVFTLVGSIHSVAQALAVQSDGKIVMAGYYRDSINKNAFAVLP